MTESQRSAWKAIVRWASNYKGGVLRADVILAVNDDLGQEDAILRESLTRANRRIRELEDQLKAKKTCLECHGDGSIWSRPFLAVKRCAACNGKGEMS